MNFAKDQEYTFEAFLPDEIFRPIVVKIYSFDEESLVLAVPDNGKENNIDFFRKFKRIINNSDFDSRFDSGTVILTCHNKKDQWFLFDASPEYLWTDSDSPLLFSKIVVWKFNGFRYNVVRYSLVENVAKIILRLF